MRTDSGFSSAAMNTLTSSSFSYGSGLELGTFSQPAATNRSLHSSGTGANDLTHDCLAGGQSDAESNFARGVYDAGAYAPQRNGVSNNISSIFQTTVRTQQGKFMFNQIYQISASAG